MSYPKKRPCPGCGGVEGLGLYAYDHGWWHVECDDCDYHGPGEGSAMQAIRSHNAAVDASQGGA